MMANVTEAKRLEILQRDLIKKFRTAEQEERFRNASDLPVVTPPSDKPLIFLDPMPRELNPLSVTKARQLENLGKNLKDTFSSVHEQEIQEMRERQKKYEPITKAITEQKEKDVNEAKNREERKKLRLRQLARVPTYRPNTRDIRLPLDDIPTPSLESTELDTPELNQSMKQLMDSKKVNMGLIASSYFPKARDNQFGIWYDETTNQPKIGCEPITFNYDDIILISENKTYKGTEGLWRLLTKNDFISKDQYTQDDWDAYKDILLKTNSIFQKNDPDSNRPKASQGRKWKRMIKQIWEDHIKSDNDEITGSGLAVYSSQPVEYKYINNFNELIKRLNYIYSQEVAGNNNFHNEKLSLVKFIHDRMEELVQTPRGTKYLVRCLSALPESVIEGSGLLNEIINKLPFELHAPRNWAFDSYNFCGPGTKLDERLARGDKGINPLDEACKEHDIWYSKYKNSEDRWQADKVLQKKAWDRVVSSDADLNERAVALATTGGMWLKRKLGMGLGTSGSMYP